MGSGNPSVELAPLRGSIEFNLDDFKKLDEQLNELKGKLEDFNSKIDFSSNIGELAKNFDEFIDKLHDIDHSFNFTSNIEKFEEQIDKINDELKDKTFVIKIKSDLGAFNSKLDKLKDSLGDDNFNLNINSNLPDVLSQVQELKEEINTMPSIKIDADISNFGNQLEKINENVEKALEFNEQEIEFFKSLGATLEELGVTANTTTKSIDDDFELMESNAKKMRGNIDDVRNSLKILQDSVRDGFTPDGLHMSTFINQINEAQENLAKFSSEVQNLKQKGEMADNTARDFAAEIQQLSCEAFDMQEKLDGASNALDNLAEVAKNESKDFEDLCGKILKVNSKLDELKGLVNIHGNVNIEGLRELIPELETLQQEISDVNSDSIKLHEAGKLTDEGFDTMRNAASDTAFQLDGLHTQVDDTIDGFTRGFVPTRHLGENLREFGEKAIESGQNLLWTGQMLSAMAYPIRSVGAKMFELGLQVSSAMSVTRHLFGASSIQVEDWSKNTVQSMGLAEGAALSTAEQFGMSARTLGANKKQAALLAEGYTQLAQHINLGTQGSISYETASQACLEAMAGQTYGLKSLGISFSKSKENAEAAALGYHKAYSKLTPVQQATVRLKLAQSELNKQFGTTKQDLQTNYGQWEKTKAQLEKVGETLGEQLVPAVLIVAKDVGRLAEAFEHLSKPAKDGILAIAGLLTIAGPVVEVFSMFQLVLGGASLLLSGLPLLISPIGLALLTLGGVIIGIAEIWKHHLIGKMVKATKKGWEDIKNDFHNHLKKMSSNIKSWWSKHISTWKNGYKSIQESGKQWEAHQQELYDKLGQGIKKSWKKAVQDTKNSWNHIKESVKTSLDRTGTDIKNTWDKCKGTTIESWNHITQSVSKALHTMLSDIEKTPFGQGIAHIVHSIEHLIHATYTVIVEIVTALVHAVWHRLENMGRQVEQIGRNIAQRFERLWNRIKTTTETAMEDVKTCFIRKWNALCSWFSGAVSKPLEYVGRMLERFGSHIANGINEARQVFENVWNALCGWFSSSVVRPAEDVGRMLEKFGNCIEEGINEARQVFDSGWRDLCGWFDGAVERPVHSAENMGSSFESTISSVISSVSNVFRSGWDDLCSWFSGASHDIVSTVENLGSAMWSAGANIIHDLLSGLTNAWGDVTSWISGKINALANSITNAGSHIVGDITSWGNDGSHATGLAYVPWDGYRAELHKGEMVLTAEQAENYRQGNNGTSGNTYNFYSPEPIDPFEAKRQMIDASRKLANGFY